MSIAVPLIASHPGRERTGPSVSHARRSGEDEEGEGEAVEATGTGGGGGGCDPRSLAFFLVVSLSGEIILWMTIVRVIY